MSNMQVSQGNGFSKRGLEDHLVVKTLWDLFDEVVIFLQKVKCKIMVYLPCMRQQKSLDLQQRPMSVDLMHDFLVHGPKYAK